MVKPKCHEELTDLGAAKTCRSGFGLEVPLESIVEFEQGKKLSR